MAPNGVHTQEQALVPTPMRLLEIATQQNADIDKLRQLLELHKEWERNEARKAFVAAMNAFKKNPPTILKNKHVKFGQTEYNHATLDHVTDAVTKALSEHGISHRWTINQDAALVTVTCILTHEQGHSEETTLKGPADNSGSKNAIQSIGSTVTYLQRYTLLAATGLAAGNDNDGGEPVFADLDHWKQKINGAPDAAALDKIFANAYQEAKKQGAGKALLQLIQARDTKRGSFRANHQ